MKLPALVCGTILLSAGYALAADKGQPLDDDACQSTWSMVPRGRSRPRPWCAGACRTRRRATPPVWAIWVSI